MTITVDYGILKSLFIKSLGEEYEPDVVYDPELEMHVFSFKHGAGRIASCDLAWVIDQYNNPQNVKEE